MIISETIILKIENQFSSDNKTKAKHLKSTDISLYSILNTGRIIKRSLDYCEKLFLTDFQPIYVTNLYWQENLIS